MTIIFNSQTSNQARNRKRKIRNEQWRETKPQNRRTETIEALEIEQDLFVQDLFNVHIRETYKEISNVQYKSNKLEKQFFDIVNYNIV